MDFGAFWLHGCSFVFTLEALVSSSYFKDARLRYGFYTRVL